MRMKSLILIVIALGCGLVASIGISQVMNQGGSGGRMEMEQILVALADIDISWKFDEKKVRRADWPKAKVPEGALRRLDDVKDRFASSRFFKGEPIHVSKVTDSPLSKSNSIPDGYRAMPVKVDEDTVMKAIAPGDRVDVMVFLKKDINNGIFETGAFTFLKNVRVFAVNTNTDRNAESSGKETTMFRTVSLLLKPEHTRELAVAARVGKIVLTLRGPGEQDIAGGEEAVSISEILKGNSDLASDPVEAGSTIPGGQASRISTLAQAPVGDHGVAWRLEVFGPTGADTYEWTDAKQLPTKTNSAPVEAFPPSSGASPVPGTEAGPTSPTPSGEGNEGTN